MTYTLGKNTTKNLESILQSGNKLSKTLVRAVNEFISVTPIDFCIIDNGGFRTAKQQNELFLRGASKLDGYKHRSYHQLGLAVDLVPWVNDKPTWDMKHCFYLSGAFMAFCKEHGYNITTGADWNGDGNLTESFSDPCHMQIGD
jgi:peptidoglycan L-alanyl-D-glutamate endopeptidase CwlK